MAMRDFPMTKKDYLLQDAKSRAMVIAAALDRAIADEEYWTQKVEDAIDSVTLQETKSILMKKIEEVKDLKISLIEAKAAIRLIEKDESPLAED